ncbi:Methyltransferase tpcH [Colletotrichum trifolii]|uniref:Methyltransferase tpcH n=1 Tax=Colletotrichum trifolii TaxID=5466 RepID=A0A4R8QHL1_COLTR|nr:Methyltransferase tpcH [Colletotrichum trifolii]
MDDWEQQLVNISRNIMGPLNARVLRQMGLGQTTTAPIAFLENACQAAPAVQELFKTVNRNVLSESLVLFGDKEQKMVDLFEKRVECEGWTGAKGMLVDTSTSGLEDSSLTHIVAGLTLHLAPSPDDVVNDAIRILKPGGVFGCTTPHSSHTDGWMTDLKAAFETFPFHAPLSDKERSQITEFGRWYDELWVEEYLKSKGLADVQVGIENGAVEVKNAKHWIEVFGPAVAWIVASEWDEKLKEEHPLSEVHQLLETFLEKKYGGEGWNVKSAIIVGTGTVCK